jgi:hypothetical protein
MQWLHTHNPSIDWKECTISFPKGVNGGICMNAQQVLNDSKVESSRVSLREFNRLFDKDVEVYKIEFRDAESLQSALELNNVDIGGTDKDNPVDPRLAKVLERFKSRIVNDIPGVAPDTNSLPRHHINWKGDKAPSRPLIRLSYRELDHLKGKLDEFLSKKWIQPKVQNSSRRLTSTPAFIRY